MRWMLATIALLTAAPALAQPTADSFTSPTPSGRRIRVTTYGDYGAWQQPGLLSVLGWEQR